MKNQKMHKIVGLAICLSVLGGLIYIILAKGRIPKQGTVILNEDNISELELDFGQELSQYVSKEDNTLFVKDITGSDLNNAYVNNELIMERCYEYSSMIPLQEKEKLTFGYSYRIPTILLRADSNILFCNENGEHWETKEKCLKITFFFDIIKKSNLMDDKSLEVGLWCNGTFPAFPMINESNYNGEKTKSWVFAGDNFYPRIRNTGTEDVIITNGVITIVRDDTMEKTYALEGENYSNN